MKQKRERGKRGGDRLGSREENTSDSDGRGVKLA